MSKLLQLNQNEQIEITQEITNWNTNVETCKSRPENYNWTKTFASIGGAKYFLKNSVISTFKPDDTDSINPNSRTAIAFNDQYVYFIVVDRWDPGVSEGITLPELANFAMTELGATHAISQDSGGSSTMAVNKQVINNTHCNFTKDCMPKPAEDISTQKNQPVRPLDKNTPLSSDQGEAQTPEAVNVQPLVANGMMMVVIQPMEQSTTFSLSETVTTTVETKIWSGPGLNYHVWDTVPAYTPGVILDHLNDLEGVRVSDSYWWLVDFGGISGWVREEYLLNGVRPPSRFPFQNYLPLLNGGGATTFYTPEAYKQESQPTPFKIPADHPQPI